MTKFRLNPCQYDKWVKQNDADVSDIVEGTLLDSVLLDCKRGVAAVFETHVNCWTSTFTVYFAPYDDADAVETVNNLWDAFAGAALVETA